MEKVAIVNAKSFGREFPEFLDELKEKVGYVEKFIFSQDASQQELIDKLKDFHYIILGNDPTFKEEFFENCPDLKLIARHGLGFNNVDLEAAKKHNVYVTKEENIIEQDAVAEHAVSLLNVLAKNINIANQMVHQGEWGVRRERLMGYQIRGKVTGVIGYGNIGRRFGEIMKYGYKNRILAYDPYLPSEKAEEYGIELVSLDELLANSDFISMHCNLTDENKKMINQDTLKKVKKGAILINCARGALVDDEAVLETVESRDLFGYGADVCSQEPIHPDNPLLNHDHIVLTPHVSVYNLTCTENMNRKVMEDIYLVMEGKKPNVIVNGL
ncbi:NAD(P)-dependent oxidoreductase [Faecalicoccus pleomorphus]|uniref:NAD(P)-dependent oxidoreductase n=1 Tax=Faecalicoccus pleomorphus TaxID=1323 RepID=UPI00233037C5|nr:NAD(P)-dependent oxidoreductase [Faecalicoccus pleomorphus]MDB7989879.1 NAD(P)-dependent oxidoreductase [Faecalicoccus pleomorphus]MDB7994375.1 NAD(P)-dependent oxidoreductase [Faecalicoccus pleomorphus]